MAISEIQTGYKPEGALGALYQGFNAADAQQENELEMIKQFLANHREQQAQPFDQMVKELQGNQAQMQNTPEMLQKFVQNTQAGYDKNIRENELGTLMQPFKKQQAPLDAQRDLNFSQIDNEISSIQNTLRSGIGDNGLPLGEPLQADLTARLNELIAQRGNDAAHWGKTDLENTKGKWDMEKQRLANQGHIAAASLTANKGAQTAAITAAGQVAGIIKNIDSKLTALENKEMDAAITQQIFSEGKQATQAEVTKIKSQLRQQLEAEKSQYSAQFRELQKQGGLQVTEQPKQGTAQNPIVLK